VLDNKLTMISMMPIQKKDKLTNGKNFGFDTEADFIPFELSDGDEVDDSRQESRTSIGAKDSIPPQPHSTRITNGDGRKRKRREYESSPDRGPPPQRQKLGQVSVNPWQTDIGDYATYKETARMYNILPHTRAHSSGYIKKFRIFQIGFLRRQRKMKYGHSS
jgi:hypothetical protein